MTAVLSDIDQMPDLDAAVPCECPGHGGDGCPAEAEMLTWNSPCGHEQETLCHFCAAGLRTIVFEGSCGNCLEEGCGNCSSPYSCDVCDADIEDLGMRAL